MLTQLTVYFYSLQSYSLGLDYLSFGQQALADITNCESEGVSLSVRGV